MRLENKWFYNLSKL